MKGKSHLHLDLNMGATQTDIIRCPECDSLEIAQVVLAIPYPIFVHECSECKYTILESEWDRQEVRSLTIKEPYASLMLFGKIETRTWPCKYRGAVLIHAAAKEASYKEIQETSGFYQSIRVANTLLDNMGKEKFKNGRVIAIGELVNTRPMEPSDVLSCFVEHSESLYCHMIAGIKPVVPVAMKGGLGYRKVEQSIINQLKWQRKTETRKVAAAAF